ncbi:phosphatidylglycerol lysyltransferase domain-containing protein [Actinomycetospora termitidis]|uniref:Phosphatidylglycerol lysyltransferase domain-containing protein n=1 Tax=Actinomycetospora termitidis TaxID=3053470 RepID=A0ABT7M1U2_9PSEU|nr:phosphatidylglycerol lysyltransferase domain-containing protein [Actinomycetospora sp. Odt1-22]MDL5154620.1 phosphatidylglycerol lysyltransferase domain-containing protein [Actinomycetospora sp. Odt1-22]
MTRTRVSEPEEGAEDEVRRERRRRARIARVVVWAARIVGLLSIVSIFAPAARRRLEPAAWFGLPVEASLVGTVVLATAGVGLMLLATGLRRRKRRAWQLAVLLCVVIVVSHLLGRHPIAPLVVAVVLLIGLLWTRREFDAVPDPLGRLVVVRLVAQLLVAGFVIVSAMLLFVRPTFLLDRPSVGEKLLHALLSLVGVEGPVEFRFAWYDDLTAAVGLTFGIGAVVLGGYFWLRSAEPHPQLSPDDEAGIRGLLDRHGRADSLGYFALRRDKSVVFSESGKAAVAYRVLAGVALASGDPLGDVEAWPGAIEEFVTTCRRHGWVPAVLGCSETGARVWSREAGLDALELGDEAVVDVATFSLQGRAMRTVRQAVSRIKRAGYGTTVRRLRDVPAAELAELHACVERWRGGPDERGFSMALSRVGDTAADPEAVLVVATAEDAPRGLLQFVPWGTEGLSLDLMIRDPAVTENGLNELLITDLLAACRGLGVDRVSLNFAVFRSALERGERIGAGPVARLWARLLRIASRWWQIETLYRFNARFGPTWVPRYLVFDAVRDLPRIAVAAFEAEGYGGRPPAVLRVLRR